MGLYSPNADSVRMMLSHLCICTASHCVCRCSMLFEPVLEVALVYAEHVTDLHRRYLAPFEHVVYRGATKTQRLHYVVRCEHLHIADWGCVVTLCFPLPALGLCCRGCCFTAVCAGCAVLIVIRYSAVLLRDVVCFPVVIPLILLKVSVEVAL